MAFEIYKQGQGKNTRLWSACAIVVIVGLGCFQFHRLLQATDVGLWIETMVPAGVFVIASFLAFWTINKPSVVDFMISAEGEMKKVSWSSRAEIAVSTFVVIAVVLALSAILGVTDLIFQLFFMWLLG